MSEYFVLSNGVKMPKIGYGTYKSTDGGGYETIRMALEAGYRLLDTAAAYGNEEQVGKAVRESGIKREEIFLTSKVWKTKLGYENTRQSFMESLERLGTEYLDLFLIHWPKPASDSADWKEMALGSWKAMEEFYAEGKARALGVSNFLPHHMDVLLKDADIRPMVNQLELHVGYMQEAAVQHSRAWGIQVQAWSPLGRQRVLKAAPVTCLAERYGISAAQFLLKFLLQQDIGVIPKASSMERMVQNLRLPDTVIEEEDMQLLRSLPQMGWSGEHPDLERVPAQE